MMSCHTYSYPAQLTSVLNNDTINLGCTNLTLTCEGYGIPAPNITWKHNGVLLDVMSSRAMVYLNASNGITFISSSLSLNSVRYQDRGLYMCNIRNEVGNDTATSNLSINYEGISSHRYNIDVCNCLIYVQLLKSQI